MDLSKIKSFLDGHINKHLKLPPQDYLNTDGWEKYPSPNEAPQKPATVTDINEFKRFKNKPVD